MSRPAKHFYEFGSFRVDEIERRLLRDGETIPLPPKAFETLLALVSNSGHLLTKDELLHTVWPDTFVEENNLTQYISALRKALSDNPNGQQLIETVPRLGYRFAPCVREVWDEGEGLVIEDHTKYRIFVREEEREDTEGEEQQTVDARAATAILPAPRQWLRPKQVLALSILTAFAVALLFLLSRAIRKPGVAAETTNSTGKPVGFRSIAVLPFKTLGESKADEHLTLGLADALITRLGNLKQITVRPTSAVQKFATRNQDPVAAGRELGVQLVLDSHVQRIDDRIRITVQLLNTADGAAVWAEKFDRRFTDIFALQDSMSNQLAQAIRINLTDEEKKLLTKRYTDNPEAYEAYLKGRYFWNKRTPADHEKARSFFQKAITLDPNYAQAYVGLADSYYFLVELEKAKEQLVRAIALDDTLAEAHASLAFHHKFCAEWDWSGAEAEFKRALDLNPNYATAHQWYAYYLVAMRRFDEAINEITRARELDPLSIIINTDVGEIMYYARRYDEAIAVYRSSLEMDPNFGVAHYLLGYAYEQKGMYEEALTEFQKAIALLREPKHLRAWLGHSYAAMGRKDDAIVILNELKEMPPRKFGLPLAIASVYAALGDKDQALEWLEKVYQEHNYGMIQATMDPRNDSLRSHPHFKDLLRRMNLTP